ncbi:MAG: DUF3540 domain-containing protein [Methylococcales bacterium]
MSNITKLYPSGNNNQQFNPALVIKAVDENGFIALDLKQLHQTQSVYARIALSLTQPLAIGDEVLIAGDDTENLYVIGILNMVTPAVSTAHQEIGYGAYIVKGESATSPSLQVFSKRNELLIEYDAASEKTRINIEKGNLEFSTQEGDIILDSSQNIYLNANTIDLESRSNIQLSVKDALGQLISAISIKPKWLKLSSQQLDMSAQRTSLYSKSTNFIGESFKANIKESTLVSEKLTTLANTITENAKNIYRTVEELSQLRTGRMRTLVKNTLHIKANKTYMKSQDDFKVNAKKIHLG